MTIPQGGNTSLNWDCNRGGIGSLGRSQKDCLVINGGKIEIYAGDDCLDANGNTLLEYSPKGNYSAVLITTPSLELGKSYTLNVGSTSYDVTLSEQNTVIENIDLVLIIVLCITIGSGLYD